MKWKSNISAKCDLFTPFKNSHFYVSRRYVQDLKPTRLFTIVETRDNSQTDWWKQQQHQTKMNSLALIRWNNHLRVCIVLIVIMFPISIKQFPTDPLLNVCFVFHSSLWNFENSANTFHSYSLTEYKFILNVIFCLQWHDQSAKI